MAMFDQRWVTTVAAYARLYRMDRPIGAFLLLWPTLWALWLAGNGQPRPELVVIFIAGTFTMRWAGCAINDYADRHFDAHVDRTHDRPLATGLITPADALKATALMLFVSLMLALQLNWLALGYATAGVVLAVIYPFLKRVTHLPQAWLGLAFSWGIPMAFAAQNGEVPALAWLLLTANFFWVMAYDTQYAMVDKPDDLRIGVKSTAILFGDYDRIAVVLCHIVAVVLLTIVGVMAHLNRWYFLSLGLACGFVVWQIWLCRVRSREDCFHAFLNNNWFGVCVFLGIVLAGL